MPLALILPVRVCGFFPFILDIKFVGRTSRGHTRFLIHIPSAVRVLIFLAGRIQPFLFLVDREVEFLCTNDSIVLHLLGILFYFFSEKNPVYRDSKSRPSVSEGYEVTSELPGRPAWYHLIAQVLHPSIPFDPTSLALHYYVGHQQTAHLLFVLFHRPR